MSSSRLWICLCLLMGVAAQQYTRLVPHVPRIGEELRWGDSRLYVVEELESGVGYEVRISYPATTPTDFVLELENGQQGGADPRARRLLNTEKLILSREECEGGACRVRVRADYAGVSLDPGLKDRAVLYNIVVEPLVAGVPRDAVKVVVLCIAAVLVAVFGLAPRYDAWLRAVTKPKSAND